MTERLSTYHILWVLVSIFRSIMLGKKSGNRYLQDIPLFIYIAWHFICQEYKYLIFMLVTRMVSLFNLVKQKKCESESEVAQLCLTLCDPIDCSLPVSSVHGIFQAIVLEWVAISFSRVSSQSRAQTWVSRIVDRCFTV